MLNRVPCRCLQWVIQEAGTAGATGTTCWSTEERCILPTQCVYVFGTSAAIHSSDCSMRRYMFGFCNERSVFCEAEAELSKLKLSDIYTETGFDPRPLHVGFKVDKAALKPVSPRVFSFQYHHILIFFLTVFTRTNEQSIGI
jgi:hypothetical protein